MNVAFTFKDSGLSSYVVSNTKKDEMLLPSAFGLTLAISAGLAATFVALSWPLAAFYRDPALGQVVRIMAMAQIVSALAFPATVELIRAMRFDVLLVVGLIGATCQSAASIALAYLGEGAAALGWGYLSGTIATAVATIATRPETIRLRPSFAQSRELLSFGGWMSTTILVYEAAGALPMLMIARALGLGEAGLFSRALNTIGIIQSGFFVAVMRPMLPHFSEHEKDGRGLGGISLRVVESVTGLAWPAYGVLVAWAEPLMRLLYGPAWSVAAPLILPLAIAQGLALAVAPCWEVLIVKRRGRLLFLCEAGSFVLLALLVSAGLVCGLETGLWGLVLAEVLYSSVYAAVLSSLIGLPAKALLGVWARSLALTVLVVPPAALFRSIDAQAPTGILFDMAASSAISALLWVIGLKLTGHQLYCYVGPIVSSLLGGAANRLTKRPAGVERRPASRVE
jgi:O-antigen/teichoic acid export membrane protein